MHDVEEEAVAVEAGQYLGGVFDEEVHVGGVQAQPPVEARLEGLCADLVAVLVDAQPLGMRARRVVVPLDGDVDRAEDVAGMAGLDLLLQQVGLQVRVYAFGVRLARVVDPAVVPAREAADLVHVRALERGGELIGVEAAADAGDLLAGVEVEMDGAVAQLAHGGLLAGRSDGSSRIFRAQARRPSRGRTCAGGGHG